MVTQYVPPWRRSSPSSTRPVEAPPPARTDLEGAAAEGASRRLDDVQLPIGARRHAEQPEVGEDHLRVAMEVVDRERLHADPAVGPRPRTARAGRLDGVVGVGSGE